jgi:sugar-specific transcriptional regulator TrmB/DNA-binding CsgD family transcriptional regulator
MLAALGLGSAEEDVYRRLVARGSATLDELRAETGRDRAELTGLLVALAGRGLATQAPPVTPTAEPAVFTAAPPAVALAGLLRQRHDDLRAAERDIAALAETHRNAIIGRTAADLIEVITNVEAVRHRFTQIQEAARHEVLSTVVPNLTVVPHRDNRAGDACLRRGVTYQAVIDRRALHQPGILDDLIASIAAGQQIRVVDQVPVKLVIIDRTLAMLPLLHNQNTAPASVLVHPSGLLDVVLAFYETIWERGYPLRLTPSGDGVVESRPGDVDELDGQVLALLLSGLTDQAVAGQLGLSLRTVQRRISQLMVKAGVDTRIQLGWYAARKGWA